MSRLFIFLLGALLGAASVYYLYDRGLVTANVPGTMPVIDAMPAVAASESSARQQPPTSEPNAAPTDMRPAPPRPAGLIPPTPVALEPPAQATPGEFTSNELLPALPVGGLLLPVAGVKSGQLSNTYTQSRGEGRSHDAIDIMAPRGTPVVAVADGKVAKLFDSKQGGLTLYQFDTGEKIAYYYAHLDSYAAGVAEGRRLKRGDLVGYVGSTGNANPDGPHLHFAVFLLGPEKNWWQGTAINPYPLLGGRPASGN